MQRLQSFRSLVSTRLSSLHDPEKTVPVNTTVASSTPDKTSESSQRQANMSAETPSVPAVQPPPAMPRNGTSEDALQRFRHIIGICTQPEFQENRVAPNKGIYPRVVAQEKMHKRNYKTFAWLINSALGLQIVFAAALTALGAGHGPHSAVTAFGALNTILAGVLTFLKGSGLPNRYKYYQNEMMKVREYIEQREREFARGDIDGMGLAQKNSVFREEIYTIQQMYERACQDIAANTPDNYVSLTRAKQGGGMDPPPSLAKRFDDMKNQFGDLRHGIEDRLESGRRGLEDRLESGMQEVDNRRHGLQDRYAEEKHGLESRLSDAQMDLQERYTRSLQGLERSATSSRLGFESRLLDTRRDLEGRIDNTRIGLQGQVGSTRNVLEQEIASTRQGIQTEVTEVADRVDQQHREIELRIDDVEAKATDAGKAVQMVEKAVEKVFGIAQRNKEDHDGKD